MAGLFFNVSSGEVSLSAATALTVLQIKAPANQRVIVRKLTLFGKSAAGGTDAVVKARLTRSTANFGTLSSVTPVKANSADDETVQTTAGKNASAEPTSPTDLQDPRYFNPQAGVIEPTQAYYNDIVIPGGTALNIELTSAGTPTVIVSARCEE